MGRDLNLAVEAAWGPGVRIRKERLPGRGNRNCKDPGVGMRLG